MIILKFVSKKEGGEMRAEFIWFKLWPVAGFADIIM
jgi:hypothetical protein